MAQSGFLRRLWMDPRGWCGGTFLASITGCNGVPWWRIICRQALGDFSLPSGAIVVVPLGIADLLVRIVHF